MIAHSGAIYPALGTPTPCSANGSLARSIHGMHRFIFSTATAVHGYPQLSLFA
jgi:hypothetical protein